MEIPSPIHPFPARMAASIPWNILEGLSGSRHHRVLDPMAGSGTTLVVARRLGHEAIGIDTDPLAVLISSCWCSDVDERQVAKFTAKVAARSADSWRSIPRREAYPGDANSETRDFIRFWFDFRSRQQLLALAREISVVRHSTVRRLLWCGFSRLIIVKQAGASLAMDVAHSRPHRKYSRAPIEPILAFSRAMQRVVDASPFKEATANALPSATVMMGDARRLRIEDASVDIVITSPPYLNAIDYLRGHKLSLVWMGHAVNDLRTVRAENIGTESGPRKSLCDDAVLRKAFRAGVFGGVLPNHQTRMFTRYLSDMRMVLAEIRRVLRNQGRAALVIGDSMLRGTFVRNSEAIKSLAPQAGLRLLSERARMLPQNRRYLPPPQGKYVGSGLAKRMRREVILTFGAA